MSRFFDIWNKSPIGWYEGLLVFEYALAPRSLDHDSGDSDGDDDGDDAGANGNANTDSGRRVLLLTSFFATILPN